MKSKVIIFMLLLTAAESQTFIPSTSAAPAAFCYECGAALTTLDVWFARQAQKTVGRLLCWNCFTLRVKEGEKPKAAPVSSALSTFYSGDDDFSFVPPQPKKKLLQSSLEPIEEEDAMSPTVPLDPLHTALVASHLMSLLPEQNVEFLLEDNQFMQLTPHVAEEKKLIALFKCLHAKMLSKAEYECPITKKKKERDSYECRFHGRERTVNIVGKRGERLLTRIPPSVAHPTLWQLGKNGVFILPTDNGLHVRDVDTRSLAIFPIEDAMRVLLDAHFPNYGFEKVEPSAWEEVHPGLQQTLPRASCLARPHPVAREARPAPGLTIEVPQVQLSSSGHEVKISWV